MNIFDSFVDIDGEIYQKQMQLYQMMFPYEHQEYSCIGTKKTLIDNGYQNKYDKNSKELICHTLIDNKGIGSEDKNIAFNKPFVALFSGQENFSVFFRFSTKNELEDFIENVSYIGKNESGIPFAKML